MSTSVIHLENGLKKKLKLFAVSQNKTLQEVSTEAVKLYLKVNSNKNLHNQED
jgi:hypothetical protein